MFINSRQITPNISYRGSSQPAKTRPEVSGTNFSDHRVKTVPKMIVRTNRLADEHKDGVDVMVSQFSDEASYLDSQELEDHLNQSSRPLNKDKRSKKESRYQLVAKDFRK